MVFSLEVSILEFSAKLRLTTKLETNISKKIVKIEFNSFLFFVLSSPTNISSNNTFFNKLI